MTNIRRGMMGAAGDTGGPATYQLWSWGSDGEGQAGHGDEGSISSPEQIGTDFMGTLDVGDEGIITTGNRIFTVYQTAGAVKGDGTLWMWGHNNLGQCAQGDTISRKFVPVQVGSLTDWRSICMSAKSACATKTDGTLWGWGTGDQPGTYPNASGQEINVSSPVQIGTATNWTGVLSVNCTNANSVLGLNTDGQLYMWGHGTNPNWTQGGFPYSPGAPNFSNSVYSRYPSPIDDKNYVMAGSGRDNVWAVENTGKLWTWGINNYGQLGHGNTTNISSPVQVGSSTDWIWTCGHHGYSLMGTKDNGEIWWAGGNNAGAFGLENDNSFSSPVQVGGPGNWASGGHGMGGESLVHALTDAKGTNTGGALWCLGGTNQQGVAGNGSTINFSSPVQIGSDTTWVAVTKQGTHTSNTKLAIKKA